ncbi:MAG TPA: hypothetical protein VLL50_13855 [Usitatibacter sp.]|nr:hypothetical protein [Usitatibacter sp.]
MKKAAWVLAVLVLVAAGAAFWAYESLDVIVKYALEHYGPQVTGVAFEVGEVKLSPRDGRGSVKRVDIGNPPGFNAPRAVRLAEISVWVDPATVRAPVVVIHELIVDTPLITYERSDRGTNLDAIQKNIANYVKRAQEASGEGDNKKPSGRDVRHRFIVEKLVLRGGKVTMTNPGLKGQGVTFDLPAIEMHDLGRSSGGATASELASTVADTLVSRIAQKLLTNLDLLRKGGVGGAIDALKGLVH